MSAWNDGRRAAGPDPAPAERQREILASLVDVTHWDLSRRTVVAHTLVLATARLPAYARSASRMSHPQHPVPASCTAGQSQCWELVIPEGPAVRFPFHQHPYFIVQLVPHPCSLRVIDV